MEQVVKQDTKTCYGGSRQGQEDLKEDLKVESHALYQQLLDMPKEQEVRAGSMVREAMGKEKKRASTTQGRFKKVVWTEDPKEVLIFQLTPTPTGPVWKRSKSLDRKDHKGYLFG